MHPVRLPGLVAASLLCLLGSLPAAAKPIPLELIAKLPMFAEPKISPDGSQVAARMTAYGTPLLVVQQLHADDKNPGDPGMVGAGDLHFDWYDWANNERLIIAVRATVGFNGRLLNISRMGSANKQGEDSVFFNMLANDNGFYRQYVEVNNWLKHDPDHILAVLDDEPDRWASPRIHKVNVNTGERELVAKNRKGFYQWYSDEQGNLRAGTKYKFNFGKTGVEVHYRATEESDWEVLQKSDYFDDKRIVPFSFMKSDPNILLMTTQDRVGDFDYEQDLLKYDLTRREIIGPYVDEKIARIRSAVEKALPDLTTEIVSLNEDKDKGFIRVYADTHSPEYYLIDLQQGTLEYAAAEYPELINFELAPMQKHTVTARDGLAIPVLLTLPPAAGEQASPAVVMPHGGPWANDEWGFDNYVQFLANRGYAVIQPQFRGSTGFGLEHEEAGYGEWGKAIQDDITDVTLWAIEQELIDPDRTCIVGSSFGGYAAAMGAIKEPELYRCVVSVNGVLDLKKFIYDGNQLLFENINKKVWNDPVNAKDYSPYHRAEEIVAPILIVGSERDTVVPVKQHSKKMHKRLKKLKKSVEYVELPDGEHWRTNEANEITKLGAIEAFLDKHIGAGYAAAN